MKPTESFSIIYYVKGVEKVKEFTISFVSNYVTREYNALMRDANKVKDQWDNMQNILTENAQLKLEKPEGWKEKVSENEKEYLSYTNAIIEVGESNFFDRRFDLIKTILIDNGYENDQELMTFDFWDRQVDPNEINRILMKIVYKDLTGSQKKN